MSSPADLSGTVKAAGLFEDLCKQLRDCHQNALNELEVKVSRLKKERCLDAQRLEVFYNRNQELKKQNKTLQDTIRHLEERLKAGGCNQCAELEEKLRTTRDQNLYDLTKLENERNRLEDENRKLQSELQLLRSPHAEPEQEEGVIPDSPVLWSSLPVTNKLKKQKHADKMKHLRFAETPLQQRNNSLFYELNKDPAGDAKNPGKTEMLVPNTCELDASQISNVDTEGMDVAIAETCALEHGTHLNMIPNLQTHKVRLNCSSSSTPTHSPDSSEKSPSVLPRIKRLSEDVSVRTAKRKKEGGDSRAEKRGESGLNKHPELLNQTSSSVCNRSSETPADNKASSPKSKVSSSSPNFKKPQSKATGRDGKRACLEDPTQPDTKNSDRKHSVAPAWSIDPALNLSVYDSEQNEDEGVEEEQRHGELADTDCTWVSHSMLQRQGGNSQKTGDIQTGLGEKTNDSLDLMFDTTACGEYKSQLGQSQPCDEDEEEEEHSEQNPAEDVSCGGKPGQPTYKYMAVVRKKDERRKLKGTTCKECEIYYAHLSEEEKQKKLSSCSRHRFLYVPPCTPENFWEVGFPSTQTCVERGYIKEEKNPQTRLRRRQPLNALFTPKKNKQQS